MREAPEVERAAALQQRRQILIHGALPQHQGQVEVARAQPVAQHRARPGAAIDEDPRALEAGDDTLALGLVALGLGALARADGAPRGRGAARGRGLDRLGGAVLAHQQREPQHGPAALTHAIAVAIAPAGRVEERTGAGRIIGGRARRRAIARPTWPHRAGHRPGQAAVRLLDQRFAIDEQRDGLAHAHVVERRLARVQGQVVQGRRPQPQRRERARQPRGRRLLGIVRVPQRRHDVDVAPLGHGQRLRRVGHIHELDVGDGRRRAVVAVEARQAHQIVVPGLEPVRAGADHGPALRAQPPLVHVGGQDRHVGQGAQHVAVGPGQAHAHAARAQDLHREHVGQRRAQMVGRDPGRARGVDRELHVDGAHARAVVEAHVGHELEPELTSALGHGPRARQPGLVLARPRARAARRRLIPDQALEHGVGRDAQGPLRGRDHGVEVPGRAVHVDAQGVAAAAARGRARGLGGEDLGRRLHVGGVVGIRRVAPWLGPGRRTLAGRDQGQRDRGRRDQGQRDQGRCGPRPRGPGRRAGGGWRMGASRVPLHGEDSQRLPHLVARCQA